MKKININIPFLIMRTFFLTVPIFIIYSFFQPKITQFFCEHKVGTHLAPPAIAPFEWKGTGIVTLWFDDAWHSQYKPGFNLMEKNDLVGALAVPTGKVCSRSFMNWEQIREMQNKGWEITSHSVNHICDPLKYDLKTSEYELGKSKKVLEAQGLRADQYVQPCGYKIELIPNVIEVAEKDYQSYRGAGDRLNSLPVSFPYNLYSFGVTHTTTLQEVKSWLDKAKKEKGWLILVFHHIDNEALRYNLPIDQFQNILTLVKESGLPVVLPAQALSIKTNHKISKEKKSDRKEHIQ